MRGSISRLARLIPGIDCAIARRDQKIAELEAAVRQGEHETNRIRAELDARSKELDARLKELDGAWSHAHKLNEALQKLDGIFRSADYNSDSLLVYCKNLSFLRDERFMSAYKRGIHSGHKIGHGAGVDEDIHIEWRVHVACWAARRACAMPGAFVECGVNTGILSLAICDFVDFNATGKDFFLFDTFAGIPESQMLAEERARATRDNSVIYEECFAVAQRNFAPFPRARLVRGLVPETFATVSIDRVAYLSIDMNIVQPEIAAMEFFWDKLVPGAAVILDDYGWANYKLQQEAHDKFAASKGVPILLLPTGQGLIIKP